MTAPKQKPIELHYWATSNGIKISIMLEECKLPYDVTYINIAKGDQFKKSFLEIAPNNRIPAIVDPNGPGNKPISIFESGAILQYLGEKTGKFYPKRVRARVEVEQWLFWQMGGLGPMCGQANHFRNIAPEKNQYAIDRYVDEVNRLYGVLNKQLKGRDFIAEKYSIADMACVGWLRNWGKMGQQIDDFKDLKKWFERVLERPAVQRGIALGQEMRSSQPNLADDKEAQKILYGQRAR